MKIRANGDIAWLRHVPDQWLSAKSLGVDSTGNIVMTFDYRYAFDFGNGVGMAAASVASNLGLAKFDSSGQALWATGSVTSFVTGGLGYSSYAGLSVDSNDNIYVAGYIMVGTRYDLGDGFVVVGAGTGSQYIENSLVVRYDPQGHVTWLSQGGPSTSVRSVLFDRGALYVGGNRTNTGSAQLPGGLTLANDATAWAGYLTKLQ
jgi:hypothetical protein